MCEVVWFLNSTFASLLQEAPTIRVFLRRLVDLTCNMTYAAGVACAAVRYSEWFVVNFHHTWVDHYIAFKSFSL